MPGLVMAKLRNLETLMWMNEQIGGCQCGELRYRIAAGPCRLNVCHCADCQRQSGSAFGMSLVIKPSAFEITQGEASVYQVIADSGRDKACLFCPRCGVRVLHRTTALCSVKAGTLDDVSWLVPDAEYFSARRQRWLPSLGIDDCHELA